MRATSRRTPNLKRPAAAGPQRWLSSSCGLASRDRVVALCEGCAGGVNDVNGQALDCLSGALCEVVIDVNDVAGRSRDGSVRVSLWVLGRRGGGGCWGGGGGGSLRAGCGCCRVGSSRGRWSGRMA